MYEITIAAILTALFICILYARIHRRREDIHEEVPDGGEDIAATSQTSPMPTNMTTEHKLETSDHARLTEYIQPPATETSTITTSSVEPIIEIEIQSSQETAPAELAKSAAESITIVEQPQAVQPQPVEQHILSVEVIAPTPVPEPELHEAQVEIMPAPVDVEITAVSPVTEFDDPRVKVLQILSVGRIPKTVREIAQAYYGKGSYNKRKDSRIRRILAEMTQEGLLIETSIANSRAFEIKKAT